MPRTILRATLVCLVLLPFLVLGLALGARTLLVGSLAQLDGRARVVGIGAPVVVERDALGVPRVRATSLSDACFAQGYLHAQDRFFQMDTMRRFAAGRLSELAGQATLNTDKRMRTLGLTALADQGVGRLPERHRAMLDAYTLGVNAGLEALDARPPEYLLTRTHPEPWRTRDCVLVAFSMAFNLEMGIPLENTRAAMYAALPRDIADFLTPEFGVFDHTIDGKDDGYVDLPPIPEGLRDHAHRAIGEPIERLSPTGSNAWLVAGVRTASRGAMLANDMHLGLSVPNIWYRVQLEWGRGDAARRLVGVSLPGVPSVVVGSNTEIAWGFTNTTGDHADYVLIETDPDDPARYRTPDGWARFNERTEIIGVRGRANIHHVVRTTRWGPVVGDDPAHNMPRVMKWIMLDPERFNLNLFDLIDAHTANNGAQVAASWFGPSQNAMIADRHGSIAWVVTGAVPVRIGYDGRIPTSWADGSRAWDGVIDADARPMMIDPAQGHLITANNRTLTPARTRVQGTHWSNASRAARIAQLLGDRTGLTERDMLAIQLDTYSMVHAEYAGHLRELVPAMRPRIPADWDARAEPDSRVFTLVDDWADAMREKLLAPIIARCREIDPEFRYRWFMDADWLIRLLRERPESWLPAEYASWEDLARACAQGASWRAWGEVNRAAIAHPFSSTLPAWARAWVNMPGDPLPGARLTVRVQTPGFGASQRLVVTPGREEDGLLHIPSGQSGHFLSRYYRAGHEAWVKGEPSPLLAGETRHTLTLIPSGKGG